MVALRRRLERQLATVDGLLPGESMFGQGVGFWANGKEVLHFHDESTVEIRLTRGVIREHRVGLKGDGRVALRPPGADWITVRYATAADLDFVLGLAEQAVRAHLPPPGVTAKPPPTGSELARRQRFH